MKAVESARGNVKAAGGALHGPRFPHQRWMVSAAAILLLALVPSDLFAQGCSMCKAVVENGQQGDSSVFGGQQSIGNGLNSGIIVLMVVPYVLLFLFFRKRIVGFFKEFATAQG